MRKDTIFDWKRNATKRKQPDRDYNGGITGLICLKEILALSFHVYDSILVHDVIFLRHDGMPVSSISGSHPLEYESTQIDIQTRFKKDDVNGQRYCRRHEN